MSDWLVADAPTYIAHNKHKRRTLNVLSGIELPIPAIRRFQTYALYCTATGIGPGLFAHSRFTRLSCGVKFVDKAKLPGE